jgi:hypothetical protein
MSVMAFLLLNMALAFYNVGTIWAHEVDIFRSWKLVAPSDFHRIQRVHWHKLPYWVFLSVALALAGSIALVWFRPPGLPSWAVWIALTCQLASAALTRSRASKWTTGPLREPGDTGWRPSSTTAS